MGPAAVSVTACVSLAAPWPRLALISGPTAVTLLKIVSPLLLHCASLHLPPLHLPSHRTSYTPSHLFFPLISLILSTLLSCSFLCGILSLFALSYSYIFRLHFYCLFPLASSPIFPSHFLFLVPLPSYFPFLMHYSLISCFLLFLRLISPTSSFPLISLILSSLLSLFNFFFHIFSHLLF